MPKYEWFGPSMPFFNLSGNPLPRQSGERILKNDILQLLFTVPGERVMRRGFGTPLKTFVFESLTGMEIDALRSDIITAIHTYDARVRVKYLNMDTDRDENLLRIRLVVQEQNDPDSSIVIDAARPLVQENA